MDVRAKATFVAAVFLIVSIMSLRKSKEIHISQYWSSVVEYDQSDGYTAKQFGQLIVA